MCHTRQFEHRFGDIQGLVWGPQYFTWASVFDHGYVHTSHESRVPVEHFRTLEACLLEYP